jgi:aryl-alcohol dehydrogenase-like predicted oxidoreductase
VKRKVLASTGRAVSEIGFGAWQLGGKGWGRFRESDAVAAVRCALEFGLNIFDTAPVYGFGRSEELLGKTIGPRREEVVVISKGGLVWDERGRVRHDNRPESLRRQLEGSLKRLRFVVLDVFLLHWPDPAVPLAESIGALERFREEGLIRGFGLSNFPAGEVLKLASSEFAPAGARKLVLELPLNLLGEEAEEHEEPPEARALLFEAAREHGWDILAFDVLARGLLAGRYGAASRFGKRDVRGRDRRYQGERFKRNLARVERLKEMARPLGVAPAALAIRGVLERQGVTACLAGMKSPRQVEENAAAARLHLPGAVVDGLSAL